MHKYVMMGPQGSGKGTQAKLLHDGFGFVHISVGDIFRWNIQSHTKLGARVKRLVDGGRLVSDEIVGEVIQRRLDDHDWNFGFLLDGFPRTEAQARLLIESYDVDAVVYIDIPDQVVFERVLSRRLCSGCGLDYNLIFHRPAAADTCDVCGGELVARADDTEPALRSRLADFHRVTAPVLELLRGKERVIEVDGTQPRERVQDQIREAVALPTMERPSPAEAT